MGHGGEQPFRSGRRADHHAIHKNGIKEIANQHGCSVTFMAKPDHAPIGSSCHVHSSLWRDGRNAFEGRSPAFQAYLAARSRT
jgi:glutamine synthetase